MIPHHSSLIKFLQIVPNLFKIINLFFRQQEECQCQKTTKNYWTVISHEATILKAAVLCLLISPNHKFL